MNVRFEHIAMVVHEEDYAPWDRFLRVALGGIEGMGGDAGALGFRGVQVPYSCGGMLEIISWSLPITAGNPIVKYLERHGPRAALHHFTFVVDSIDVARDRCRRLGYEFMQGRETEHWKEIYLRAPFFEPPKLLIQLLEADKEKMRQMAGDAISGGRNASSADPAVRIAGGRLACSDAAAADRAKKLFCDLLEATAQGDTLTWKTSSMQLELLPGAVAADSHIAVELSSEREFLLGDDVPAEARLLIRPSDRLGVRS